MHILIFISLNFPISAIIGGGSRNLKWPKFSFALFESGKSYEYE